MTSPVASWIASRCGASARQRAAVRRSCQTIARPTGTPVARFQSTTVSRWFVMPIALRHEAALRDRLARRVERAREDLLRVVLDLARLGKMLRDLAIAAAGDAAVGRDDQARRAGGALVNRENAFHR